MGLIAGFLGFIFIVFVVLAFVVSPSVIAGNLELDKKTRRIILWFDLAPVLIFVVVGILSEILQKIGADFISQFFCIYISRLFGLTVGFIYFNTYKHEKIRLF